MQLGELSVWLCETTLTNQLRCGRDSRISDGIIEVLTYIIQAVLSRAIGVFISCYDKVVKVSRVSVDADIRAVLDPSERRVEQPAGVTMIQAGLQIN